MFFALIFRFFLLQPLGVVLLSCILFTLQIFYKFLLFCPFLFFVLLSYFCTLSRNWVGLGNTTGGGEPSFSRPSQCTSWVVPRPFNCSWSNIRASSQSAFCHTSTHKVYDKSMSQEERDSFPCTRCVHEWKGSYGLTFMPFLTRNLY